MRVLFAVLVVFVTLSAQALPMYFNKLRSEFPEAKLTQRCQICHTGGPQLNLFGKDFYQSIVHDGLLNNEEAWFAFKAKDSDEDGMSNEDELNAGRLPGKKDQPAE